MKQFLTIIIVDNGKEETIYLDYLIPITNYITIGDNTYEVIKSKYHDDYGQLDLEVKLED